MNFITFRVNDIIHIFYNRHKETMAECDFGVLFEKVAVDEI